MALASIPTRSPAAVGCARRIDVGAHGTDLILDDGRRIALPTRPDDAAARRCRRAVNHVVSVRIDGSADDARAQLRGVGNRLPVTLAIPRVGLPGLSFGPNGDW